MLRFAIISLSTLGVLGLLFYLLVLRAQPPAPPATTAPTVAITASALSTTQSTSGVGPGYKPWIINYENGKPVSQFTATRFEPQKTGEFIVENPIAIFFLDKGQYLKVTGDKGLVSGDAPAPNGASKNLFAGPTSSPRNGSLHHVRAEMYSSPTAAAPSQWMETENIYFDNQTIPTMYTESYIDPVTGETIASDQVAVTVRGDEYEFDGKGLKLQWNAQKHLQKLEIAHGKRLSIKDPSKLTLPGMAPAASPKQTTGAGPFTDAIASIDPRAISLISTAPPAAPVEQILPYRAIFQQQVKIDEADRTMAAADLMMVDFLQGSGKAKSAGKSGTAPNANGDSEAAFAPAAPPAAANVPASILPPQSAAAAPTELNARASAQPTTKSSKGPITIRWTGPLLVTPLRTEPLMPLSPGQSVVRLTGAPVRLTPEGSTVTAAVVTYRSPDGAVHLDHSSQVPMVELTQDKGLTFSTGSISYDPATAIAMLKGISDLSAPVNDKAMMVHWTKQGQLHLIRLPGQPNGVDHVDLLGDVTVTHPQFQLQSKELQLDLDLLPKPGGNATEADEQLKTLTAIDEVQCRLTEPGKPVQGIDTDHLVIATERTADHKTAPREIMADGHVHAFDPDRSLTAGHLDALLIAKTQKKSDDSNNPAVGLERLDAAAAVHIALKDGASASAEELHVTSAGGKQQAELKGPGGAILTDGKGSWLSGPIVRLFPDTSGVRVLGPGQLEAIRRVAPGAQPAGQLTGQSTGQPTVQPAKPIDITWTDSLLLDGSKNIADVLGQVNVRNTDAVGTVSNITADKAHLDLVDMPKNANVNAGANTPVAADPQANQAMGGKQLKVLTLSGNVVGTSELLDAAGNPLRRGNLYGEKLIYTAADGNTLIPGPGKLFVENHKHDDKTAAAKSTDANSPGGEGAMAVQWSKQLNYSQANSKIVIDGDTRVGFEQEAKPGKPATPMQLDSQQLIINLAKNVNGKNAGDANKGKPQVTSMQSLGNVHFLSNGIELFCSEVDHDLKTSILTAKGDSKQRGRATDANQTVIGSFDQLRFDTVKQAVIDGVKIQGKIQR